MTKNKPSYGKGKTPGHFCVIPQRAVIDPRFKKHSSVFRVLCAIGNYTSRQGVAWPNQRTLARDLSITQSTVSRHIKKLIEFGYIRYARKHPGLKGLKYFMVFDPSITEDDAKAIATEKDRSFTEKPEIPKGPKGIVHKDIHRVNKSITKNNSNMGSSAYKDIHSDASVTTKQNNIYSYKAKMLCNEFVRITEQIFGTLVQYNIDEMKLVQEWLQQGLNEQYAVKRIKEILEWRKANRYDCPKRIVFYKDILMRKPKPRNNKEIVEAIIKKTTRSLKIK